ncbi:hypothetical protein ACIA5D_37440 [Actinoplanes sp. NPDC051513]|uniref:hypothetical protein n=1 Tax=Actinoplanes sp. NPDC051513 TaxID=3363908 RepID=UPI0037AD5A9C
MISEEPAAGDLLFRAAALDAADPLAAYREQFLAPGDFGFGEVHRGLASLRSLL